MNNKSQIFFGVALAIMFVLSVMVLSPFLITLSLSIIVSMLLYPLHKRLSKFLWKSNSLGAIATIILFYMVILVPISLISFQIFLEAQGVYSSYASSNVLEVSSVSSLNDVINSNLKKIVPESIIPNVDIRLEKYIGGSTSWIASNLGAFFSGTFDVFLKILIMTIAMFFLLKDGEKFQRDIKDLIPVSSDAYDYLAKTIKSSINFVVFGSLIIAAVQGIISGIGFLIFDIPNATLWGTVAALASFIPGFGTGAVFIPIIIYAFLYGTTFQAIGLLLWAVIFVNAVDNLLRPVVMQKSINIHPLFVLFSVLGGISFIGPAGFILGPLILSLLFAMVKVYKMKEISISKES
jgi:predicted PurR-regulated permease PerM